MLSGLSIHIALAPSAKPPIAKLVTDNGGSVAELLEADVAISRKGSAQVKNIDDAGIPCVSTTWLRQTISEGEPLQYTDFLLGAEGKSSPKREREESEDVPSPAKKQKREQAPQKKARKKRLQLALSTDADSATLLPIIKQLGGVVSNATSALTNLQPLHALISPAGSKTGEAALAIVCERCVVSEAWAYASLEAGEWREVDEYLTLNEGYTRSSEEAPPFEGKAIFITGKTSLAIGSSGVRLLVTRGGGAVADSAGKADVVVCLAKTFKGIVPRAPVVTANWLLDSAEAYKTQPLEDYLLVEGTASPKDSPAKKEPVKKRPAKKESEATKEASKQEKKKPAKGEPEKKSRSKQVEEEKENVSEQDAAQPVPVEEAEVDEKANKREVSPALSSGSIVIDDSDIVV